jgi:hypothetical protein
VRRGDGGEEMEARRWRRGDGGEEMEARRWMRAKEVTVCNSNFKKRNSLSNET